MLPKGWKSSRTIGFELWNRRFRLFGGPKVPGRYPGSVLDFFIGAGEARLIGDSFCNPGTPAFHARWLRFADFHRAAAQTRRPNPLNIVQPGGFVLQNSQALPPQKGEPKPYRLVSVASFVKTPERPEIGFELQKAPAAAP